MHLSEGTTLQGGRYLIEKVIGQGGFGITYLGEQVSLGRKVAIKEFYMKELCNRDSDTSHVSVGSSGSYETVDSFRQKFIKEARNIAKLKHRNVISIIDIFEDNGTAYYVMEYVEGGSLADKVSDRALSEKDALRYIRQVASALDYLHGKQMMHLDVKPANILIDKEDNAVLIDFGLSKQYDSEGQQTSTTPVGLSRGYAPFEQYNRGGVSCFSPATDIYSLGATLYKLVTGQTPPEVTEIISYGFPELPSSLSPSISLAIESAMKTSVKERPQNVGQFLSLLYGGALQNEVVEIASDNVMSEELIEGESDIDISDSVDATCLGLDETCFDSAGADTVLQNIEVDEKTQMVSVPSEKLNGAANVSNPAPQKPVSRPVDKPKPRKRGKKILVTILLLLLFGALGFGAYVYWNKYRPFDNEATGAVDSYEYVDLGLPSGLRWATCNLGAYRPDDFGDFYCWGECTPIGVSSYPYMYGDGSYVDIGDNISGTEYDAATYNWGGGWRMPTEEEFQELIQYCFWEWKLYNGIYGYEVTGSNGNKIFLPVYGCSEIPDDGVEGRYWASTVGEYNNGSVENLCLGKDYIGFLYYGEREKGYSIRPVWSETTAVVEAVALDSISW